MTMFERLLGTVLLVTALRICSSFQLTRQRLCRNEHIASASNNDDEYKVLPDLKDSKERGRQSLEKSEMKGNPNMIIPSTVPKLSTVFNKERIKLEKRQKRILSLQRKKNAPKTAWKADYMSSNYTQKRIRNASFKVNGSAHQRCIAAINTLLETPSTDCNESNVIATLTLTAKIISSIQSKGINQEEKLKFRRLLHQTLDRLHSLVEEERLNTRQLANAVWSIAKHFKTDPLILPLSFSQSPNITSRNRNILSHSEVWDVKEGAELRKNSSEERVLDTLILMASQMNSIISGEVSNTMAKAEISMICWAYAILFPRTRPAGWKLPLRDHFTERMSTHEIDAVKFEKWHHTSYIESSLNDSYYDLPESTIDTLFDSVAIYIIIESALEKYSWKEISTIAWAYGARGHCQLGSSLKVLSYLSQEATSRLKRTYDSNTERESIQPRDISQIAWALGILQADNHHLSDILYTFLDAIEEAIHSNAISIETWKSPDLVQVAVAMAHGRIDKPVLLKAIFSEALISLKQERDATQNSRAHFHSWELSALLWVQARLYLTKSYDSIFGEFADILPQVLMQRIQSTVNVSDSSTIEPDALVEVFQEIGLGAQEQANLAWSLTVLEKYNSSCSSQLLKLIFDVSSSRFDSRTLSLEHAHQLWQSLFILKNEIPEVARQVRPDYSDILKELWLEEKARPKKSSARHKSLSETLHFMGVAHFNEHDEDIDVAIVLKQNSEWTHTAVVSKGEYQKKVAVEFDGPAHFTVLREPEVGKKADPPRALGHTVLKYRILKMKDWTVIRIPYYEYDRIPFWYVLIDFNVPVENTFLRI